MDEFGCTPSETYSGAFSVQLGVDGCVPNGTSVTFCHIAGLADDPANEITLTIAIAGAVGEAGHFGENGTTNAGHEQDYVGPCIVVEPPVDTEEVCQDGEIVVVPVGTVEDDGTCDTDEPPVDEPPVDEPPVSEPPVSEPPVVVPDTPEVGVPSTPADTL